MSLSFAEKAVFSSHVIVFAICAYDPVGRPCYFMLKADKEGAMAVKSAITGNRQVDLTAHGTILARGWGHEIPASLLDELSAAHDAEPFGTRRTHGTNTH